MWPAVRAKWPTHWMANNCRKGPASPPWPYFGVSGSGRVLHTMNPRLHPDQLAWIANHAEDQVLCFDMSFLPL